MQKYGERHASVCVCPCNCIVCIETSYIPPDDCFAVLCRVNRDWLAPHHCSHCLAAARYRSVDTRKNSAIIPNSDYPRHNAVGNFCIGSSVYGDPVRPI